MFFRSNEDPSATRSSAIPQQAARPTQESLVRLVEPSDKRFATKYAYFVMEQMTTCVFTESDRLGKRKCHKIGFPGMACRHCYVRTASSWLATLSNICLTFSIVVSVGACGHLPCLLAVREAMVVEGSFH